MRSKHAIYRHLPHGVACQDDRNETKHRNIIFQPVSPTTMVTTIVIITTVIAPAAVTITTITTITITTTDEFMSPCSMVDGAAVVFLEKEVEGVCTRRVGMEYVYSDVDCNRQRTAEEKQTQTSTFRPCGPTSQSLDRAFAPSRVRSSSPVLLFLCLERPNSTRSTSASQPMIGRFA